MANSIGRITLAAFVLLGSASTAVAQQIKGCVVDNNLYGLRDNSLNNDWRVRTRHPLGDLKLAASLAHRWNLGGRTLGLLAEKVYYKQFAKATYSDGTRKEIEEVACCYKPGRNIGVQVVYKL